MSESFGFEYFCGANVLIRIDDIPVLEAAGLSYSINESKIPIYGYSSRLFDAVARGQVIIQGTLLINYVHQDYLFHALNMARERAQAGVAVELTNGNPGSPGFVGETIKAVANDSYQAIGNVQALKDKFWNTQGPIVGGEIHDTYNPHDDGDGYDIKVTFGEQDDFYRPNGQTGYILRGVQFMGRSTTVRIDEEVIVEAYPFIARNVYSLKDRPTYATSLIAEEVVIPVIK